MTQKTFIRSRSEILSIVVMSAAILGLTALAYVTRFYLLASLIGVGFGVLIAPVMNLMQTRFKIPRALSALSIVVLILGGIAGASYGMFILLSEQVGALITQGPEILKSLQSRANQLFDSYPWVEEQISKLNLGQSAKTTLSGVFQGLQISITAVAGFVVILSLAIFTAINARSYFDGFLSLFPAYRRPKVRTVLNRSGEVLSKWFLSQLIVMSISGAATTLGLWILGIDYWLLLGVLTGALGIIPYVGAFLTVILTALVTLGSEPDKIWWVLGIYLAVQQLEGDLVMPLVMKEGVRIPEAHLIMFMLIMGSSFGLLGVFAAPPLLAVIRIIYLMTYVPEMDRRTRHEGEAA